MINSEYPYLAINKNNKTGSDKVYVISKLYTESPRYDNVKSILYVQPIFGGEKGWEIDNEEGWEKIDYKLIIEPI